MEITEEDDNLNLDDFMHQDRESMSFSSNEKNRVSFKIVCHDVISFGFLEVSNKRFFVCEELLTANMKVKLDMSKAIQLSYVIAGKKHRITYDLYHNQPLMIKMGKMLILSFRYPPSKYREGKTETASPFLMRNYNQKDNALIMDCPYRHIMFEWKEERAEMLRRHALFNSNSEVISEEITIRSFEEYREKVDACFINDEGSFEMKYMTYANVSEILLRKRTESIVSLLENYKNDMKFESLTMKDNLKQTTKRSYYIMKHIQITTNMMKIRKESFHQPSRFLRLYYANDNFIKIEFKDDYDGQLFTNNGLKASPNQRSEVDQLYHIVFQTGLTICNRHYLFFLNPTNAMRSNSLWLLEENESKAKLQFYYNELGLYNLQSQSSLSFSKLLSRLSQNFTSTSAYSGKFTSEIIDDLYSPSNGIYNDGCGKISKDLLRDICKELNKDQFESAIQIRYKGAKGVLVVSPSLPNHHIQFTKSMVKFQCENSSALEVIRFSKYSIGYLNLQIIILLIMSGIKKKVIYSIAKKEVMSYQRKEFFYELGFEKVLKDIQNQSTELFYQYENEYMTTIAKSTYIYNRLANIAQKYRFHMKNCAFLIGVIDFDGLLREDEVFVQIKKPNGKTKVIHGDILITKNPCLSLYDLQKVKGINHPLLESLFHNVIIFPAKGHYPLPSKITGSDLDGDIYWVCWDKRLAKVNTKDYNSKCIVKYDNNPIETEEQYTTINGRKRLNQFIRVIKRQFISSNDPSDMKQSFQSQCLKFHCYYHHNYKLPEVNKKYLTMMNRLFQRNNYKEEYSTLELETLAVHHSIEVDFQKTGETSLFTNHLDQPAYLTKKHLRSKMNFLYKIKEIYEEYTSLTSTTTYDSFYSYFINAINQDSTMLHHQNHLRLYQQRLKEIDLFQRSFIYKIYELVSFVSPLKEAFMNSIFLMANEFFYQHHLNKISFTFKDMPTDSVIDMLSGIRPILHWYTNEIKYIMHENELINEIELAFLIEYLEPKIAIFKNDVEDYRMVLNQQLSFTINKSIKELNEKLGIASKGNIAMGLFIMIYWVKGEKVLINNEKINIDNILGNDSKVIISQKDFIEDISKEGSIEKMKVFLYDHFKSITLLHYYLNNLK